MKIIYSKASKVGNKATSVTASSENADFPASNLLLGQVSKVWRSVAAAAQIAARTLTVAIPAGIANAIGIFGCKAKTIAYAIMNTAETTTYFSGLLDLHKTTYSQVTTTYAASGSSGITVTDDADLDTGTGSLSLVCRRNLSSWVEARILMEKHDDTTGYRLSTVVTTGYIKLEINDTVYTSTSAPPISANQFNTIAATVSVGAANTTVAFLCNGVAFGAPAAQANETTTDNAVAFYAQGTDAIRTQGADSNNYVYNRALSAAEVLALHTAMNDPTLSTAVATADQWGSQTAVSSDTAWTGASGTTRPTGWSAFGGAATFTIFDSGDGAPYDACLKFEHSGAQNNPDIYKNVLVTPGQRYRFSFVFKHGTGTSGTVKVGSSSGNAEYTQWTGITDATWTKRSVEFVATTNLISVTLIMTSSTSGQYELFDEFVWEKIGCTLALEPAGIHKDKWYDSSTNALDASYPAAGTTITPTGTENQVIVPDTSAEPSYNRAWVEWANNSQALHIILTLNAHPTDTYHEVGEIVVGETVTIPDPQYGLGQGRINNQVVQRLAGGGRYVHAGSKPRSFSLSWIMERETEFDDLDEIYEEIGENPLAMMLSDNLDNDLKWCGYFHMASDPKASHDFPAYSPTNLELEEAV